MVVATSNEVDPSDSARHRSKSTSTPVTLIVAIANSIQDYDRRQRQKPIKLHLSTGAPEYPRPRLWNIAESIIARIEVLEQSDLDYSHSDRSSINESTPANDEAERSLDKIIEAALARISVLEKRRDISYRSAFKSSNGTRCIIRGCGSNFSKREHTVRHIKTTSTPEHQVAAIVLQQKECLECDMSWRPHLVLFIMKQQLMVKRILREWISSDRYWNSFPVRVLVKCLQLYLLTFCRLCG